MGGLEYGLQVHGLPHGAGLDVFRFQGQAHGFSVCAELFRGDASGMNSMPGLAPSSFNARCMVPVPLARATRGKAQ